MKRTILYIVLIASLNACSQKKGNVKEQNMEITSDNIANKTVEQIKHYPSEPIYYVYAANSLCIYELLVNDLPVYQNYEYEQLATPIYINRAILKSGRQKITYRIYPAPKEFNGGSDVFDAETEFRITVCKQDLKRSGSHEELQIEELPTQEVQVGETASEKVKEFVGKGQKYYEHTFYFDATVPYEIAGWSKGRDLRNIDPDTLKQAVVRFYNLRKKMVENKDRDALARQMFLGFKEPFISEYRDAKYVKDSWNSFISKYDNPTYEFQSVEKYKMEFFSYGQMVCLRQISTDPRQREKSALWGKYKDLNNGDIRADFHRLYLFIPEGKGLEDLQMIR
ncbi:hypothetical protein [uncultured Flavobacterium sp.]|uniref:hypothetical protein n=1 Tax=uncultured Flavobacterium sp. TaxID=165435 RepID=UPI0025F0819F|nr:hypothetical protein [uncultured Flavobacterium sp.]